MFHNKLFYLLLPLTSTGSFINIFLSAIAAEQPSLNDEAVFEVSSALIVLLICIALIASVTFFFIIYQQKLNFKEKTFELENTDHLTGERNQRYFLNDAAKILKDNPNEIFSVIQINIRNFKYINDVYSSMEGDELLKYLAKIISAHLERDELQTRANADNFIILLKKSDTQGVLKFFNEIKLEMHKRVGNNVDDIFGDIYCGIFLGGCDEHKNINEMCECASIALRKASADKLNYVFYEEKHRLDINREAIINKSMYDALKNKEFQFFLQPQHNIKQNNRITCAEALVRWKKSDGSMIFPNDFIPIFEHNGFIVELDRYIFEEVCKFIKENLSKDWFNGLRIAVNVSRYDLLKRDFVDYYTQIKNHYEVPDNRIELEFTESVVFEDFETFKNVLMTLKENGFVCSLDDFGAGSSSLNVLKELYVDILKLDRLFFTESEDMTRNNSLIASIVAMARGLNMRIVAEGIEDENHIDFLRRIGCDMVQGYVFSKPLPIPDFIDYIKQHKVFSGNSLPRSSKVLLEDCTDDNDKLIRQKYSSTLNFVNALVMEIDLDADNFKIVSFGNNEYYYSVTNGSFSLECENYALSLVHEKDRDIFKNTCNIQHILSCFYRGDETIPIEFRAKTYNKETEKFNNSYEWHCLTMRRLNLSDKTRMFAMAYIQNIQERYDNQFKLKSSQNRLSMALRGINGTIYEVNFLTGKINLVHGNIKTDKFIINDGMNIKHLEAYIDKFVHEDDREKLKKLCGKSFADKFMSSGKYKLILEFRRISPKNDYIWKSMCITRTPDEPHIILMLVQDISSLKLTEAKLINSERRLRGLINNLYLSVTEVDIETNTFDVIKAYDPRFWEMRDLGYDGIMEYIYSNFQIHPDYVSKLRKVLSRENIAAEFAAGNDEFHIDYLIKYGSQYVWHSVTVKREEKNKSVMLITDINRQKQLQDKNKDTILVN